MSQTQTQRQILKDVFCRPLYVGILVTVFSVLLVSMLNARQFLFFEPYLVFQLPKELWINFSLIVAVSALSGFMTSLVVFQVRKFRTCNNVGTGMTGSIIGASTGVCTSCGTLAISVVSTFGLAGVTALSFLEVYEIPIRLATIGILAITSVLMLRNLSAKCKLQE
jgi:hypothetical protein